jgi:hypothetical protein
VNEENTPNNAVPHRPRRRRLPPSLVRRKGAATMCGMGVSTFDRADAAGLVPAARRVGGCKLWCVAELRAWAARGCPDRQSWQPIWQALLIARRTGRVV